MSLNVNVFGRSKNEPFIEDIRNIGIEVYNGGLILADDICYIVPWTYWRWSYAFQKQKIPRVSVAS